MHHALETSFSDAYCSDECLVTQLRNIAHFKVLLEFCKKIYVSIYFLAKKRETCLSFFNVCLVWLGFTHPYLKVVSISSLRFSY